MWIVLSLDVNELKNIHLPAVVSNAGKQEIIYWALDSAVDIRLV